jgi:3-oxoacid CoA-transferase subunit A
MNKVVANADEAIRDVFDGAVIMIGGFGLCGMPENLIRALVRRGTKNLTTISNNVGVDGVGNGLLLAAGQIVHHIGTYVGENKLHSRRGRGDSGVLYTDRRRHHSCRGKRDA